jgi:hypothetical protein
VFDSDVQNKMIIFLSCLDYGGQDIKNIKKFISPLIYIVIKLQIFLKNNSLFFFHFSLYRVLKLIIL